MMYAIDKSFANVFTIQEWKEMVALGVMTPDDGTGYLCPSESWEDSSTDPFTDSYEGYTHVAWYNK